MHLLGLEGMPRRVATYSAQFATANLFISLASFALGASTLIFVYNMVTSWRGGPHAPANPWRGMTLEWQVSSPPPIFNFDRIPTVVGGPYEYGVPGAVHGILVPSPTPATVGGSAGSSGTVFHAAIE
jgi:cytochrome c oxidase subunit 1